MVEEHASDWRSVCANRGGYSEYRRDKHTSVASRESGGSTEVLIVITDLQVSAEVLGSDLAAR